MEGWVKIHRKITDWEWYSDSAVKDVMLHFILTANYQPSRYKGYELNRGDVVCGTKKTSSILGISEQQFKTALDKLVRTGEIKKRATNKFTIVTLCKYECYQLLEESEQQTNKQQTTNNQTTNNKQSTTLKEIKNKESNNNISSLYSEERIEASKTAFYLAKQSESWRESVMMNLRIGKDDAKLNSLIIDFQNQLVSAGEAEKKETDLKSHFLNWARVFLREERRNQEKQKKNTSSNKYADNISEQKYTEEW